MTPEKLERLNKLHAEARAAEGVVRPLFELLEQIDEDLEHGFGDPEDIRRMKPTEVFALLRLARKLRSTAHRLRVTLECAESIGSVEPIVWQNTGTIRDPQHPVLLRIKEEYQSDREHAARICRRGIHEVGELPDEVLVYPLEK